MFRGPGDNLNAFLTQYRLYFFLNPEKFNTKDKKTTFIVSYIRGTAYATFKTRLSEYLARTTSDNTKRLFIRVSKLESKLNLVFRGINKKRTAKRKLYKLKQGTATKDYAANFQRVTAGLGQNDKSLIFQYYAGLKPEVRIIVLRKETQLKNLNELIKISIKEDDLIYQIYLKRKGQAPRKHFNKSNQGKLRNSLDYYGLKPIELDALQRKPKQ